MQHETPILLRTCFRKLAKRFNRSPARVQQRQASLSLIKLRKIANCCAIVANDPALKPAHIEFAFTSCEVPEAASRFRRYEQPVKTIRHLSRLEKSDQ